MYSLKEERISQLTPFSVLADNKRLRSKVINGNSYQNGIPTSELPVEIQSLGDDVNLFDKSYYMNSDLWTRVNNYFIYCPVKDTDLQYFKNKLIGNMNLTGISQHLVFGLSNDNSGTFSVGRILNNEKLNSDVLYDFSESEQVYLVIGNGNTLSNIKEEIALIFNNYNIKIQKGTVGTAYSEYGKGTVEIKQSGKNFLNIESTHSVTLYEAIKQFIPAGTYHLTANSISSTATKFTSLVMFYNDTECIKQVYIGGTQALDVSVVLSKECNEIRLYANSTYAGSVDITTTFNNLMLSRDSGNYEPYKSNNYVIPTKPLRSLPNGVCDTIEEDGIHRRVGSIVLDGSDDEDWKISGTESVPYIYLPLAKSIDQTNNAQALCSHFVCMQRLGLTEGHFAISNTKNIIFYHSDYINDLEGWKAWLKENLIEINYELAEEVIEPFDKEQQGAMNSIKTIEGINYFSLVGDLQTTLTFDYNPQITEEIKRAFKYNLTKAYLEVAATEQASGFQINEDNYLQSLDFDDCRYVEGEGIIGSCVAKELQGKFVNVDTSFDIENKELECFIGAETEDKVTHYLRLGTFIVQRPENDNVKDNTTFDALDYMIKFNVEYVHRLAKYFLTEDTDILQDKTYYIINEDGDYEEVVAPVKEDLSTYYEVVDEYTLMELLKDICDQSGVTLGTFNFRNADYIVHGNRFDSGVTCRDVLKAIAQAAFSWARINEYNELLLDFETSDTIIEEIDYNEYYKLSFNDEYGPVNTIVMKNSQAEGENITIKNENLITKPVGKNKFNFKWFEEFGKELKYLQLTLKPNTKYTMSSNIPKSTTDYGNIFFYANTGETPSTQLNPVFEGRTHSITTQDDGIVNIAYRDENEELNNEATEYWYQIEEGNPTEYEPPIETGTKELAISDNPFAYSEETRKALIQAGEALYGFAYIPLSVETIGTAYLNCIDKLKVKNMQDVDVDTYIFDTRIIYQGSLKSNVETLAMTDIETKYRYDGSLTTAQRRTEFRVNKAEQQITSLVKLTLDQGTKLTKATQDLEGFERLIEDTTDEFNKRVTTIEETVDGLITEKAISGGQNLIKNSVGYFGNDFWQINSTTEGKVISNNSTDVKQNSISGSALELQAETIYQNITEIKNGEYYISFNYKRIIDAAIATLKINDLIIDLTETNWKEEAHLINVTTNNITIEMTTDLNSSILITDLMLTEGNIQVSWTQNANESYTDTVQIGKGVRITASGSDTEFVAEASGITINNTENGNKVAEFTKYGTETQELIAHKNVTIADSMLIQKIGNQTWFSSL